MHLVVAANEVLLDSVENVEPHGGTKKLGTPFNLRVHVRLAHGSMTNVLGNVVGSHGDDRYELDRRVSFLSHLWLVEPLCRPP